MSEASEDVVTIGISFTDNPEWLKLAIRSVFAQTHRAWRLILVDDRSTSGCLAVCRAITDPRVEVCSDGANRGLGARLNQIAASSRSTYLCRMDADDMMHPERLHALLSYGAEHPDIEVMGSGAISIDEEGAIRGYRGGVRFPVTAASVLARGLFAHPTVFGKTAWFRANPYDGGFRRAQDVELWTRTAEKTKWGFIERPLLYYREPAAVKLDAYVASSRAVREIVRRRGRAIVGTVASARLMVRSYLKEGVYRAAASLGAQGALVARRSRAMSAAERQIAEAGIRTILTTRIPGLD